MSQFEETSQDEHVQDDGPISRGPFSSIDRESGENEAEDGTLLARSGSLSQSQWEQGAVESDLPEP